MNKIKITFNNDTFVQPKITFNKAIKHLNDFLTSVKNLTQSIKPSFKSKCVSAKMGLK